MTAPAPNGAIAATPPAASAIEARPAASLLRFITCGSVDDGKSTLIGRLLYESRLLPEDQLAALQAESARFGTQGDRLDLALLVDGLAAEREQGITIDVAYRYFATPRRAFIVADTPGHEQYTRNMATGASTADLAVILIDARQGILPQTRRHALIVSLLGVRHVVAAVNKMDLVDWSPFVFARIERDFADLARRLGVADARAIPVSALDGDNVAARSAKSAWYHGPTLLEHLESVEAAPTGLAEPFRMPIQWVNRPDPGFRGYAGMIASGRVAPGDRIAISPSGREAIVARIVTYDGDLAEAEAGQSVTVTLDREIDVSRGDVVAAAAAPLSASLVLEARLLWMAGEPLRPGGPYLVKLGALTVPATLSAPSAVLDIATLEEGPGADSLAMNAIGRVRVAFDRPVPFAPYARNRDLGGFIVIDRLSNEVVGLGLVEGSGETPGRAQAAPAPQDWLPPPRESWRRSALKTLTWRVIGGTVTFALVLWLTGSPVLGAALAGLELLAKPLLGFAHERLWARSRYGLPQEEREPMLSGGEGI